jgi:flagellar protein FliS
VKAARRYAQSHVTTADSGKLVVLLYDGLLATLERACQVHKEGDRAAFGTALRRATAIVQELRRSLRPEHSPELSERLRQLYDYAEETIVTAHLSKDASALPALGEMLKGLRDAWEHARQAVP